MQVDELVSSSQLNVDREEKVFQVYSIWHGETTELCYLSYIRESYRAPTVW